MIFKLLLIFTALLIIVFLTIVNLLVVIISLQNRILQAKQKVNYAVNSYLDLIPQALHESKIKNDQLLAQRTRYYRTFAFEDFLAMQTQLTELTSQIQDPSFAKQFQSRYHNIQALVHDYNTQLILYQEKLKKPRYQLIKYLDFRYGDSKYNLLSL